MLSNTLALYISPQTTTITYKVEFRKATALVKNVEIYLILTFTSTRSCGVNSQL